MPRKSSLRFLYGQITVATGLIGLFVCLPTLWMSGSLRGQSNAVATVSAASFLPPLAPEAIASAFGQKLATRIEIANGLPLPTSLAGTTVRVNGTLAQLFFVSPAQINYLIPMETPAGNQPVIVTSGDGTVSTGTVLVGKVAPGIFTANASGKGLPAAVLLRLPPGGQPSFESVDQLLTFKQPGERLFLILYLCGVRQAGAGKVKALILGNELPAEFAAAPGFVGLDQVNVELPEYLSGRGRISLQIKAEELLSNTVDIQMGGPDLRTTPTTTVTSSANPAVVGQEINYIVRVAAASGSRIPSGNVTLTENGAMIGKKTLDASGQAIFTYLLTATGGRVIAAAYEGDNYFRESGGAINGSQIITKARASVTLTSSSNPASLSQPVLLTASVRPLSPTTLTPAGVVQFKENNAPIGPPVTLTGGSAEINLNLASPSGRSIIAEYLGDPNFDSANSSALSQTAGTAPLLIRNIVRTTPVYAGDEIVIQGSGFTATAADHEVKFIADAGLPDKRETTGQVFGASFDQLRVRVPFGAGSGKIRIKIGEREIESAERMEIGTSVSGFVQEFKDGSRRPVAGVPVTLVEQGITVKTNNSGVFILKNAAPATRANIMVSGVADNSLGYQAAPFPMRVVGSRDNQLNRSEDEALLVEVVPDGTPALAVTSEATINETLRASAQPAESAVIITSGQVVFDTNNSTVGCPQGNPNCRLALAVFNPRRTPTNLPAGRFSSTIAQITPFGATFASGGKLTFPNSDNLQSTESVRVFRYDPSPAGALPGQFTDIGPATISSDGTKIETEARAITVASYYFVSRQWPTATIIGLVTDADGRAARRAVVNARGQSVFTGNNGGFVLANVPVLTPDGTNDQVTVEITFVRADGSVARTERTITGVRANESRTLDGDFVLSPVAVNRPPQILAPPSLVVTENLAQDFAFTAIDPDGHPLEVTVTGAPFASRIAGGEGNYLLRLTPGAGTANTYRLVIRATDQPGNGLNLTAEQTIPLIVRRADNKPSANYVSVATNEDTPVTITLSAGNTGGSPVYQCLSQPARGTLTCGGGSNAVYTPAPNFNGTDGFSFKVIGGNGESNVAAVYIVVNPVNDAPAMTISTPVSLSANAGETVRIDLSVTDADAEQTLSFSTMNLPPGASFIPSARSAQFRWTPIFAQTGSYSFTLSVNDNGAPVRSDSRTITINTEAKWAKTSGPEGGAPISFLNFGGAIYAGTSAGGIYRSINNGSTWVATRNGLAGKALTVNSLAANGNSIFAGTFNGVYRSDDNGQSWVRASSGFPSGDIPVFALVAKDGILFAGTGDLIGNGRGMFRSTNNGQSWTEINNGLSKRNVTSLVRIGAEIFASTGHLNDLTGSGGLFRTSNNGDTWVASANGIAFFGIVPPITTLLAAGNVFFAATVLGLYRSTDSGRNWSQVGSGLPAPNTAPVISLTASGNTVFAGTFGAGAFRSDNNGGSFTSINNGLTGFALSVLRLLVTENGALLAGTGDQFGRGSGLYRSLDGGGSWQLSRSGITASLGQTLLQTDAGLFVGTAESGVNRSSDNGQSWVPVNNGLAGNALVVHALAKQNGVLFAGTDGDGVYRSTNNGQSWTKTSTGSLNSAQVFALAVAGDGLYAGAVSTGVYRSTDSGQSWSSISGGLTGPALNVYSLLPIRGAVLAATDDGVYRLTENSQTWVRSGSGLAGRFISALLSTQNFLFAATLGGGVFRSTDNGQTWLPVNTGLSDEALNVATLLALGDSIYLGTVALNVGGEGVFRSTDGGQSWQPFRLAFGQQSVYALETDGQRIFAASFGDGVFVLANNVQSWAANNANLGNRFVNAVFAADSAILTGTLGGGVFRSANQGQSWQSTAGLPPNSNVQSLTGAGNQIYAGLFAGGVYRSGNGGANWTSAGLTAQTINTLVLGNAALLFAGTDAGVQRSPDQGTTWQPAGLSNLRVVSLVVSGNRLLAGTYGNGIHASTDNGTNWTQIGSGANGLMNLNVTALTLGTDGTTLFAGTDGGGVYRSTNGGISWTAVNTGLPITLNVFSFSVSGTKLYVGSIYGVFLSEDNGGKWTQLNAGLLNIYVTSLTASGKTLIAGTRIGGVFTSQIP